MWECPGISSPCRGSSQLRCPPQPSCGAALGSGARVHDPAPPGSAVRECGGAPEVGRPACPSSSVPSLPAGRLLLAEPPGDTRLSAPPPRSGHRSAAAPPPRRPAFQRVAPTAECERWGLLSFAPPPSGWQLPPGVAVGDKGGFYFCCCFVLRSLDSNSLCNFFFFSVQTTGVVSAL